MKPSSFAFTRAETVEGALAALRDGRGGARLLAGGQSLVPMMNLRLVPADRLVALGGLSELRQARQRPGAILYGALLTHAAFEDRRVPDASNGLMPHVASRIAFRSVRNRGTIGGALALADPAADWVTTCIALEARMHLRGPEGERVVPAGDFILGPYHTALSETEILTGVEIGLRPGTERWGHAKVAVKVGDYAASMAVALVDRAAGRARLVLGAVAAAPLVLPATARAWLEGMDRGRLAALAREEIAALGGDFTRARLLMHATTAVRALEGTLAG